MTLGGTPYPRPCVFPFIFQGRRYNSCTRDADPEGKLWCSVQVQMLQT
ncbi:MAG: fibronectin type II domain-containing protein [bacterium]